MKEKEVQSGDPMKIELFLEKIDQEMIRTVGTLAACDIFASWTKSCCVINFGLAPNENEIVLPPSESGLLLRKEPEGGMMWDPRTGAVYKLSEGAYHALLDLDSGLSEKEVSRRNRVPLKDVKAITERLQRIVKS